MGVSPNNIPVLLMGKLSLMEVRYLDFHTVHGVLQAIILEWFAGKPGMLQSTGSHRVGRNEPTEQQQGT